MEGCWGKNHQNGLWLISDHGTQAISFQGKKKCQTDKRMQQRSHLYLDYQIKKVYFLAFFQYVSEQLVCEKFMLAYL